MAKDTRYTYGRDWRHSVADGNLAWQQPSRPHGSMNFSRVGEAPGWWVRLFNNRPLRMKDKMKCREVLYGADYDNMVWQTGNRKPHHYYW